MGNSVGQKAFRIPDAGEVVRVLRCSWCASWAIVMADKRGKPYLRCADCGSRSFAGRGHAAIELAEFKGLLHEVSWPPED